MQDKTKLDYMAKKYKEEMMRLYSMKKPAESVRTDTEPIAETSAPPVAKHTEKYAEQRDERPAAVPKNDYVEIAENQPIPPMPKIPADYGRGAEEKPHLPHTAASVTEHTESKFPTAEEIMNSEKDSGYVQTAATIKNEPQFEPAEDIPHHQGNYNYDAPESLEELEDYVENIIPEADYPDEDTDFEDLFDGDDDEGNPPDMDGTGYLQIEVRTGDNAMPVDKAAVIVTQKINGQSYLVTMKLTDRNGTTEIIPLPAPSAKFSEAPDPSERPFSEYNAAVYKKGFYVVPDVTVPIFDTIKSIQPVALIPLAEQDLQGYRVPNGGGDDA